MARSKAASRSVVALRKQIVSALEQAAGRPARARPLSGHPEPITFYGISTQAWRELRRAWREPFASLTMADRLALASLLLRSHVEEEGHVALAVLRAGLDRLTPDTFDDLDDLLDDFSSWSMTDDFASGKASITWHLLQRYPKETLRLLARWNRSRNQWKRRASVITFTRRVAYDGTYLEHVLAFCEALQHDPEDLVQKGVGWALKDAMLGGALARRRVIALVKRMRRAGVSATITLYAIRRLKGPERDAILRVRPARGQNR